MRGTTGVWRTLLGGAHQSSPTSAGPTSAGPTSAGPTSAGPTSAGPTSAGPTSAGPTSAGPTSAGPTSAGPTSAGPTSAGPTSAGPTSAGPTSAGPTSAGADLTDTDFTDADLTKADLSGAFLRAADLSGKPPSVPTTRPAAIEPIWAKGRLTIPKKPAKSDLNKKKFAAALSALRAELGEFANDVANEANIDRRIVKFLKRLSERIPESVPPQDELFRLGHIEQVFASYVKTVDEEWPDFLASRYHAVVLQFDRTLRQLPLWREFKKNAAKETMNAEQIETSTALAKEVANLLRRNEARDFVDPAVPNSLGKMAEVLSGEAPADAIEAGKELLAFDIIESINNTLKPIAEQALLFFDEYTRGMGKGFKKAAKKQAPIDGEKVFKWLRRFVIAGTAGAAGSLSTLIVKYPDALGWLRARPKIFACMIELTSRTRRLLSCLRPNWTQSGHIHRVSAAIAL